MSTNDDHGLARQARAVAIAAHAGQVDKAGEPYWRHPERVSSVAVETSVDPHERILLTVVAWLHDVLEDTNVNADDLRQIGFPTRAVLAVESLTRRDWETYEDFIERVSLDPIASAVKMADLADNLDPGRRWQPSASHRARYLKAQERLGPVVLALPSGASSAR